MQRGCKNRPLSPVRIHSFLPKNFFFSLSISNSSPNTIFFEEFVESDQILDRLLEKRSSDHSYPESLEDSPVKRRRRRGKEKRKNLKNLENLSKGKRRCRMVRIQRKQGEDCEKSTSCVDGAFKRVGKTRCGEGRAR